VFLNGKKWLGKKDKKGWHYDKILVHVKNLHPIASIREAHLPSTNCKHEFISLNPNPKLVFFKFVGQFLLCMHYVS
jgi:hypothetical protein